MADEQDHTARLNAEAAAILTNAVAHRSARLAQEGGARIGIGALALVGDKPVTPDVVDGLVYASTRIQECIRADGAVMGLPTDLTDDLAGVAYAAFWRVTGRLVGGVH